MKTGYYIKLMRPKHWVKNGLIFVPLFFNKTFFETSLFFRSLGGTIGFSLIASSIYIINDITDYNEDKNHPTKCTRPIASGKVPILNASIFSLILLIIGGIICYRIPLKEYKNINYVSIILYFIINLMYSIGKGKNIPLVDIVFLVSGFLLRLLYGASISGIVISNWLYLVVMSGAFFLGLGKRRNELKEGNKNGQTRKVLNKYTFNFLDKNMYICFSMMIIFYALWCSEQLLSEKLIWTVPLIIIIFMKYSLNLEDGTSDGDSMEVILKDKVLVSLAILYIVIMFLIIY